MLSFGAHIPATRLPDEQRATRNPQSTKPDKADERQHVVAER